MEARALLLVMLAACGDSMAPQADAAEPSGVIDGACEGSGGPRVLVYTYENQWRHESNLTARGAIYEMCTGRGFTVSISNDPHVFNPAQLATFDVAVFAVTSGRGLDEAGRRALEAWLRAGGGLVGLHSADATEQDFPFYVDNIGPQFRTHAPGLYPAMVRVVPGAHPITDGLADFPATDEWYNFQTRPEDDAGLQLLLAVDEATLPAEVPAENRVGYHPIGWAHARYGARVFFTAMGHNPAVYAEPTFHELLGRAIEWAARRR